MCITLLTLNPDSFPSVVVTYTRADTCSCGHAGSNGGPNFAGAGSIPSRSPPQLFSAHKKETGSVWSVAPDPFLSLLC